MDEMRQMWLAEHAKAIKALETFPQEVVSLEVTLLQGYSTPGNADEAKRYISECQTLGITPYVKARWGFEKGLWVFQGIGMETNSFGDKENEEIINAVNHGMLHGHLVNLITLWGDNMGAKEVLEFRENYLSGQSELRDWPFSMAREGDDILIPLSIKGMRLISYHSQPHDEDPIVEGGFSFDGGFCGLIDQHGVPKEEMKALTTWYEGL